MMTSKRIVFLASLRQSVFGPESNSVSSTSRSRHETPNPVPSTSGNRHESPETGCSLHRLDPTNKTDGMLIEIAESAQQTHFDLHSDLFLSSDDSDIDPNFEPSDSTISDSDDCDENNGSLTVTKKKKKKKILLSTNQKTDEPKIPETDSPNIQNCGEINCQNDNIAACTTPGSPSPAESNVLLPGTVHFETPVYNSTQTPHDLNEEPKKRRKSNPDSWKRNVNKTRRLKGEDYTNTKGNQIPAKPIKPSPCREKSTHQCSDKIPEEIRKIIFDEFHSLKTLHSQREYLVRHITREQSKRKTVPGDSRKQFTKKYHLSNGSEFHIVCREFFLATLGISEGLINGAFNKLSSTGMVQPDERGGKRHFYDEDESFMKEHILSFPALESHYCRSSSEFKYLDSQLNIKTMYTLYEEKSKNHGKKTLCYETYRKMFKSYKLKFHCPKKDICKTCIAYNESSKTERELKQNAFNDHMQRKEAARERRNKDKESAIQNEKILSFNFDLESVLSTPKGAAGPFFYVRKLAIYNLTIYNLGNGDVTCYTWDETEGRRGSAEIATCIYKYAMSHPGIEHIRMMSDGCPGQQKNFSFSMMCMQLLKVHATLQTIDHAYFESGHSQMECDSAHSKIERKSKNIPVYTHEGWTQVMRMARSKPRPFNVITLKHNDFMDFNPHQEKFAAPTPQKRKGKQENNETEEPIKKIKFNDAVWFQYRKSEEKLFLKSNYIEDGEFEVLTRKQKRGRQKNNAPVQLYENRLGISVAKKKDLMLLCRQSLIPREYHDYYENLPASTAERDCLPEPDNTEEDP